MSTGARIGTKGMVANVGARAPHGKRPSQARKARRLAKKAKKANPATLRT